MKKLSYIIILINILFSYVAKAQNENKILTISSTFVSGNIWRGTSSSEIPNFQPTIDYTFNNFCVGTWASTDFVSDYQEFDLYFGYTYKAISATFYDYFWNFPENYFNYKNLTTSHYYELELIYEPSPFPIKLQIATMLYGVDKKFNYDSTETNLSKNNHSIYMELGYNIDLKATNLYPFVGITPFDGLYGQGFDIINLGFTVSKELQISNKFILPIFVSTIINPQIRNYYCVFGFGL